MRWTSYAVNAVNSTTPTIEITHEIVSDPRKMFTIIAISRPNTPMNRMPRRPERSRLVIAPYAAAPANMPEAETNAAATADAPPGVLITLATTTPMVRPIVAQNTKNRSSEMVGESRLIAPWMTTVRAIWAMKISSHHWVTRWYSSKLEPT